MRYLFVFFAVLSLQAVSSQVDGQPGGHDETSPLADSSFRRGYLDVPTPDKARDTIPIDDIQVYDPATGVPDSPYNGQVVAVEGRVYGARGDEPGPTRLPVEALVSDYENVGSPVCAIGTVADKQADEFYLEDGGYSIRVEIDSATGINIDAVDEGDLYKVISPCFNFDGEICLLPRRQGDLVEDPPVSPFLVKADGTGDFMKIQEAIDAAIDGETVQLDDGIYSGDGNRDLDFHGKKIVLCSLSNDPAVCIIECGGSAAEPHRGVTFASDEDANTVLRGITIRGGYATERGGGVLCTAFDIDLNPKPVVDNCVLEGNQAPEGAGFAIEGPCRPTIENCVVLDNDGPGGGWYPRFSADEAGIYVVDSCCFEGNTVGAEIRTCYMWADMNLPFHSCEFVGNDGDGLYIGSGLTGAELNDCILTDNGGWGLRDVAGDPKGSGRVPGSSTSNCCFARNVSGGAALGSEASEITDSIIELNGGPGLEILGCAQSNLVQRCTIRDNAGTGILLLRGSYVVISANEVYGNELAGVVFDAWELYQAEIHDNLIYDNGGTGLQLSVNFYNVGVVQGNVIADNEGSGVVVEMAYDELELVNNTIAANDGHGITWNSTASSTLSNNILAYNGQHAYEYIGGSIPELFCTDIYGNLGGDWTGVIADQYGTNGNFADDPLFCDAAEGDYALQSNSPCLLEYQGGEICGRVGALDRGCFADVPVITSIVDVPEDQGGQVRLTWERSCNDRPDGSPLVVEYGIYREIEVEKLAGWDFVSIVPARGDSLYETVVPTLVDSTVTDGLRWSVFMVSAMTAVPQVFYDSAPASGYSVDNIVPPPPSEFMVAYGPANDLTWSESSAPDLAWYDIHRGTTPDFTPTPETLVHQTQALTWKDSAGTWGHCYKLIAVDDAGQKSAAAVPSAVTGADDSDLPVKTALLDNRPNPFNPQTTISFDLLQEQAVNLRVYDVTGRLVVVLMDNEVAQQGRNEVVWRSRDQRGYELPSGTYFYRLEAGGYCETKPMTLLK